MNHILKIKNLTHGNMVIGFVGIDLDTGEIKQYSIRDLNCNQLIEDIFRIDMNSLADSLLKFWIKDKQVKGRYDRTETLPQDLKCLVEEYRLLFQKYFITNGFCSDDLDFNMRNLEIDFSEKYSDDKTFKVKGDYFCPKNSIVMIINKPHYNLEDSQKKSEKYTLLHEIGHLSVTRSIFDSSCNVLHSSIGLAHFDFFLEPIVQVGEDRIYEIKKKLIKDKFMIVEETLNELECSFITPDYNFVYPRYGSVLNKLSEGSLIAARHEHDSLEYFKVMMNIIDDENLAHILLDTMSASVLSMNQKNKEKSMIYLDQENIGKSMKLLRRYENAKVKKRS